jgi:tripartite-type tricarboxylate transporter receptor subunit TctC
MMAKRGKLRPGEAAMTKPLAALLALELLAAAPARAQTYPSKTITIVSPAPAGGVTDIIGRGLAQRFAKAWGQQAVVENKPGANNQLAAEYVVNSPPDGHTLFIAPDGTFVANPSLYPRLPYDPYKSFTPISGLMINNHGLILNKDFAPNNVAELIGLARQKPGEINYGTYGIGSSGHLNMVLLETMAGLKLQPIHYKGAAPVLNDVLAGHIQMGFVSAGSAVQQWKGGLLKMIAVGGKKRIPQLPDIPTVAETVPGFEAVSWFGLFGPAGMPPDTVTKINAEVRALFADPDFQTTFLDRYLFQSIAGSSEELMSFVRSEEPKWHKIITDAKIKVE